MPDAPTRIASLISDYKLHIRQTRLEDELYKWRLIPEYEGRPDLEATDFKAEIRDMKYANLVYQLAPRVAKYIVEERPEEYRQALRELFDESRAIAGRVETFESTIRDIFAQIRTKESFSTYHDERMISAILTVKYPERYTFYKDSFYRKFCGLLGVPVAKAGAKFVHYLDLINTFRTQHLLTDPELLELVDSCLTPDCYRDPSRLLLAQDILYQCLDRVEESKTESLDAPRYWLYAPGEKARFWDEFYEAGIAGLGWEELGDLRQYNSREEIAVAWRHVAGTELAVTNDSLANYQFADVMKPGDVIIAKRGRTEYLGYGIVVSDYFFDNDRQEYKSLRKVDWKRKGSWPDEYGNIAVKTLTDITDLETDDPRYSTYAERLRDLLGIGKEEIVISSANPQIGTLNQILYGPPGTGKTYNSIDRAVQLVDGVASPIHSENKARFDELRRQGQIEFVTFHQNYAYEDFMVGIRPDLDDQEKLRFQAQKGIFYRIAKRARDNYDESRTGTGRRPFDEVIAELLEPLERGEEVPVVMASGISFRMTEVSEKSISFTKQSGGTAHTLSLATLRDVSDGTRDVPGGLGSYYTPLVKLINERRETSKPAERLKNFVLIIDEINRANISRVFGELITLLEEDKRLGAENELRVTLPNGEKDFGVPPNLYIVGTMNTADKSIALVDIALRRRFEFVGFHPKPDLLPETEAALLAHINARIFEKKKSADYLIGHAYFMNGRGIEDVLRTKVVPLLSEYFSGKPEIIKDVFDGSSWSVTFNTSTFEWDMSEV